MPASFFAQPAFDLDLDLDLGLKPRPSPGLCLPLYIAQLDLWPPHPRSPPSAFRLLPRSSCELYWTLALCHTCAAAFAPRCIFTKHWPLRQSHFSHHPSQRSTLRIARLRTQALPTPWVRSSPACVGALLSLSSVNSVYNSNGLCHDQCSDSHAFAVVQGQSCWCSNYIPQAQQDSSKCNVGCPGFPDDKCGNPADHLYGYIALTMSASGTQAVSTSASSTVSPASAFALSACAGHLTVSRAHRHPLPKRAPTPLHRR